MNYLRWIAAAATAALSVPVFATPTPVTTAYDFNTAPTASSVTVVDGTTAGDGSYNGFLNGGYFGNSLTYNGGTGKQVTVTAWASTGGSTNNVAPSGTGQSYTSTVNGTLQNAVVTQYTTASGATGTYGGNGTVLAETSRDTGVNNEFSCSGGSSNATGYCTTVVPQHAIDNSNAYETLMFQFQTSVTLSSVTLGYPTVDNGGTNNDGTSDLTYLYCTAKGVSDNACMGSTFGGKTYSQLVSSGDWAYGNLLNLSSTNDTASTGATASSKYWMIGAYIADLPSQVAGDGTPDYVKIRAITVSSVPEPSSIALFGIAGTALWMGRRRRTLRVV